MTNADVIRQMTDDELYRFLGAFEVGDIDYALTSCNWCGEEIDCATCFRRWLFGDANDYKGLLADKGINSGYADRKTENSSEKPNNCDTCKNNKLEWYSEVCDGCSKAHSNYEPKDEPQTDYDKGLELFANILFDKEKSEQFLKECKAMGIEPQTERSE